jgi:hypothetical protein
MASPSKPDPNHPGKFIPNPDAPSANTVAGIFGNGDPQKGWAALSAFHDLQQPTPIKNRAQAESIIADSSSSPKQLKTAQNFIAENDKDLASAQAGKLALKKAGGAGGSSAGTAADSALVDALVSGHVAPEKISQILSKNPKLIGQVMAKDPSFDSSKIAAYPATYKDFTSGKTSVALNAGGTALGHLKELQELNTNASHIPHTPAWTAYTNKVDTVASELAKFYGDTTIPAIAGIKETLNSTLPGNRDAAIRTQAQSMGRKIDAYQHQWQNAAPSKAYQAPMPGISASALAARAALDPEYAANQGSGSGSQAQPSQQTQSKPAAQQVVPVGATPGRNAAGQIIGYRLPNGQTVRF